MVTRAINEQVSPAAVDSNGDSSRARRGGPATEGDGSAPDVRDVRGRARTERAELTNEGSGQSSFVAHRASALRLPPGRDEPYNGNEEEAAKSRAAQQGGAGEGSELHQVTVDDSAVIHSAGRRHDFVGHTGAQDTVKCRQPATNNESLRRRASRVEQRSHWWRDGNSEFCFNV